MTKLRRYLEVGASYFVTSVVKDREKIFLSEKACKLLIVTMQFYKYYLDYKIYAFVIMPDHFHAIIQPGEEFNISVIMNKIKGNFGNKYNKIMGREGKLWQSRFYDEGIRESKELQNKIEYIHNNPVRAGIVKTPGEYEFSSYNYYYDKVNNYLVDMPF
ncbi:MAG: transposase [Thermoanaerobacteraceae bacterium]|nr:transposase [Thermoanaerobacteraceae bacterium]